MNTNCKSEHKPINIDPKLQSKFDGDIEKRLQTIIDRKFFRNLQASLSLEETERGIILTAHAGYENPTQLAGFVEGYMRNLQIEGIKNESANGDPKKVKFVFQTPQVLAEFLNHGITDPAKKITLKEQDKDGAGTGTSWAERAASSKGGGRSRGGSKNED